MSTTDHANGYVSTIFRYFSSLVIRIRVDIYEQKKINMTTLFGKDTIIYSFASHRATLAGDGGDGPFQNGQREQHPPLPRQRPGEHDGVLDLPPVERKPASQPVVVLLRESVPILGYLSGIIGDAPRHLPRLRILGGRGNQTDQVPPHFGPSLVVERGIPQHHRDPGGDGGVDAPLFPVGAEEETPGVILQQAQHDADQRVPLYFRAAAGFKKDVRLVHQHQGVPGLTQVQHRPEGLFDLRGGDAEVPRGDHVQGLPQQLGDGLGGEGLPAPGWAVEEKDGGGALVRHHVQDGVVVVGVLRVAGARVAGDRADELLLVLGEDQLVEGAFLEADVADVAAAAGARGGTGGGSGRGEEELTPDARGEGEACQHGPGLPEVGSIGVPPRGVARGIERVGQEDGAKWDGDAGSFVLFIEARGLLDGVGHAVRLAPGGHVSLQYAAGDVHHDPSPLGQWTGRVAVPSPSDDGEEGV
mmetsp:Transcript_16892/g.38008  ORF Transcript_16892/g.38008 Transcript_16892/m.38008 type:complete len:471 (+) Transcript_16892:107-1519(+)